MNKLMPVKTLDEYLKQVTTHATAKQKTVKPKYRIIGFYKETEFQETPIGKIPKEWKVLRIKDLFNVVTGTTPSTKVKEYWEGGTINWITPQDLSKLKGKIKIHTSERKITEKALRETHLTLMPKGSIIISTRAPVGYVAVIEEPATFNQGCKGLIPKNKHSIITEFYAYYLVRLKPVLEAKSGGSTFKELSKNALENTLVLLPPLVEQWGIAEVLSTVDRAIEETEKLIEKLERLKKALMQELLTKGIGHKEYKQTPIGKIPKEWKIVNLGDIGSFQYGITISAQSENTGIKLLRITDIKNGRIDWDNMPYCKVSERDFKRYKVNISDILFARIGATTGKTCYVDRDEPAVFGSYLIRFIPSTNEIDTKYLYYFTQSAWYWVQVDKLKGGQLKKGLNTKLLAKIKIPLPQLEEQRKIANILSSVDEWIMLEMKRKEKFERLKRGLLGLLLTGRVRVRVERVS